MLALEQKSLDHQVHLDSSSGDHKSLYKFEGQSIQVVDQTVRLHSHAALLGMQSVVCICDTSGMFDKNHRHFDRLKHQKINARPNVALLMRQLSSRLEWRKPFALVSAFSTRSGVFTSLIRSHPGNCSKSPSEADVGNFSFLSCS